MDQATQRILAEYIAAREAGEHPDPEEYASRCPEGQSARRFFQLVTELEEIDHLLPDPRTVPKKIGGYRVEQEIGAGGMGVIFAGEDELGARVAIKALPEQKAFIADNDARFQREIEVLFRLLHPNIARVVELVKEGGKSFLVMELLPGGSLEERLEGRRREGRVADDEGIREMCGVLLKVTRAVASAHARGVVHRDIKPSNILFDEQDEPKLTDFGLAYLEQASTLTTGDRIMGTPVYLAPERILDPESSHDPRIDIYSLGVTLYEAIAGRPPYQGTMTEILAQSRGGPPSLRVFLGRPSDPGLVAMLERCLAYRPKDRYQNAEQLAADLHSWLEGKKVLAQNGAIRRRLAAKVRRHPVAAVTLCLLFIGMLSWQGIGVARAAERRSQVDRLLLLARDPTIAFKRSVCNILELIDPLEKESEINRNSWSKLGELHRDHSRPQVIEKPLERLSRQANAEKFRAEAFLFRASALGSDRALKVRREIERMEAIWLERDGRFEDAEILWNLVAEADDHSSASRHATLEIGVPPMPTSIRVIRYRRNVGQELVWQEEEVLPVQDWTGPIALSELKPGSYRVDVRRHDSSRWIRHPILLYSEATITLGDLILPADEEIGDEWEYVPAGLFVAGGDSLAESSEPRTIRYLDAFFIKKREETMLEFLTFLLDLSDRGVVCDDPEFASLMLDQKGWQPGVPVHIPRDNRDTVPNYDLDGFLLGTTPYGGTSIEIAAHKICPRDAQHYVAWLNRKAEERGDPWVYSLPTGDQWEKAARGADGRPFSWGAEFSWGLTHGGYSRHHVEIDGFLQMKSGQFPADCSPYGVFDMVGNVREICSDREPVSRRFLVRGGEESFYGPDMFRLAARRGALLDEYNWDFGIRLVRARRPGRGLASSGNELRPTTVSRPSHDDATTLPGGEDSAAEE